MSDDGAHVTRHLTAARDHMAAVQARLAAAHAQVAAQHAERLQNAAQPPTPPPQGTKR